MDGAALAADPGPARPRVPNAERNRRSRQAILDAAEQIMRDEGYAAVSSRRIASAAGLKSQLVHYYFRTMDALFLALFRNVEAQFAERLAIAVADPRPLRAVWNVCRDTEGPRLTKEFMAMATHHAALRQEIGRAAERTRGVLAAEIERALIGSGMAADIWPPLALAVLMDGTARLLVADGALGAATGHGEAIALIEREITRLEAMRGQQEHA